jgi:hypothetical protein
MIAAIRARFTPTPAVLVWNDTVFNNWLNAAIPFSLAHFWTKTSFNQVDLRYKLFPPIVLDDPRLQMTAEERKIPGKDREYLVNGVSGKVSDEFKPDWGEFDSMLIWFAQATDLFGGGSYPVTLGYVAGGGGLFDWLFGPPDPPKKYLPVAVCDILSSFDQVAQEVGHSFGMKHPLDTAGIDYGDPYDSMASITYGGRASSFIRMGNPQLPVGIVSGGIDPQTVIGPLVSAANLYISPIGRKLKDSGLFFELPQSFLTGASSFTLSALDFATDQWPAVVQPILAVVPPTSPGGEKYFLELRRNAGYDAGLNPPGNVSNAPPVGIVIHAYNSIRDRVVYIDTLPLTDNAGDKDYHVFGGASFAFRITSINQGFKSVTILAGGGDFWRHFGINIEESRTEIVYTILDGWLEKIVSPCFLFPPGSYFVRYKYSKNRQVIVVSSFGYETPGYVWRLNNVTLDNFKTSVDISVEAETPKEDGTKEIVNKIVPIYYVAGANSLSFTCDPREGNFSVLVEVRAVETSPSVLKNIYEDRVITTSVNFQNVELEWNADYLQKIQKCEAAIDGVNRKRIPQRQFIPKPEPEPFNWPGWQEVISDLADKNPVLANSLINEISRIAKIEKIEIIKRLQ